MINKLMVSGCSYTVNQQWPSLLFPSVTYTVNNLAVGGSGNEYISNSIMYNVDSSVDFVYVLWSGINRTDMRVPDSGIFRSFQHNYKDTPLGNSRFLSSGHGVDPDKGWLAGYNNVKAAEWPDINSLEEWFNLPESIKSECLDHKIHLSSHGGKENTAAFCHQYFVTQHLDINKEYRSEQTFQHLLNCFLLLEKLKIPYRFSFIYDIWNKNEYYTHGTAVKEKYHDMVDWSKFINFPPYQYGIKYDLLDSDGYHLTRSGMNTWASEISKILQQDQELQHLF